MRKILNIGYCLIFVLSLTNCTKDNEETVDSFITQELETQEWSGKTASKFNGGTGTQTAPYQIATGSQLALLARSTPVNKYYVLTQDINLKDIAWTPINLNSGNFDGANHTIKGLNTKSGSQLSALFSSTSGTISNLNINGASISAGSDKSAVLCAEINGGTVSNCTVSNAQILNEGSAMAGGITAVLSNGTISNCTANSLNIKGTENVGGIVGKNNGNVKDCKVDKSDVTSASDYAGGICGFNTSSISGCTAVGTTVKAVKDNAGGIVGINNGKIEDCKAENSDVTSTSDYAGGICGFNTSSISGCTAVGTTVKAVNENAGGIAGKTETAISNNKVKGSHISATNYAGGIIGWSINAIKNNDVINTDVTAQIGAGGISGDASGDINDKSMNISGCNVSGCKITANTYSGGITPSSVLNIKDCHVQNTTVSSNEYVTGGLVGYLGGNVVVTDCSVETSNITSKGTLVGGAVGAVKEISHEGGNDACTFSNIQVTNTNVVGTDSVGGIFGSLDHFRIAIRAKVIGCKFSGSVKGRDYVGGISGYTEGSNYENCAVEADVTGRSLVGGILGLGSSYCDYVRTCSVRGLIQATEKCAAGIAGTFYGTYLAYNYFIGNVSGAESDCMVAGAGLRRISGSYFVRSTDDKSVPWRWEDNQYSKIYTSACSDLVSDIAGTLKERVTGGDKYYNFSNTFVAYGCTCPRLIWE